MSKLKPFGQIDVSTHRLRPAEKFNSYLKDDIISMIECRQRNVDELVSQGVFSEEEIDDFTFDLLNQVINSFLSKINTKDIVILDEPTDGFSDQQLDKMRDVLLQLNAKQLILVSHEQKIESFVENVIRFRKENGVSNIVSESLI